MALRNDYGFHEYTYQDSEYIIRAMNTKLSMLSAHACTFSLVTKPYTYGSSCSRLHGVSVKPGLWTGLDYGLDWTGLD